MMTAAKPGEGVGVGADVERYVLGRRAYRDGPLGDGAALADPVGEFIGRPRVLVVVELDGRVGRGARAPEAVCM